MARRTPLKGTTPAENHRLRHGEVQLNCDLPKEMVTALDRYCKREGEKRKMVVARVLLKFLVREGVMRT